MEPCQTNRSQLFMSLLVALWMHLLQNNSPPPQTYFQSRNILALENTRKTMENPEKHRANSAKTQNILKIRKI